MSSILLADLVSPRTKEAWLARHIQTLKGIGFVSHRGRGTGRVQAYGTSYGDYSVIVQIVAGGAIGVAQYRASLDGGASWSSPAVVPATPTSLGVTGVALLFSDPQRDGDAAFVEGDTYAFRSWAPSFDTTSWVEGSTPRTLLEVDAEADADLDRLVGKIAQGGTLDAEGDWLDLFANDCYDERRKGAVQAKGECVLFDAGGIGPRTIEPRQLKVRSATGLRFINEAGGTLPLLGSLSLVFVAEKAGRAYNIGTGSSLVLETSLPGVVVSNPARPGTISWLLRAGVDRESDADYRNRCRKKWGSLSVHTGVEYHALEASEEVTRVYARASETVPGQVDLFVAGAGGPASPEAVEAVREYLQDLPGLTSVFTVSASGAQQITVLGDIFVRAGLLTQARAAAELAVSDYAASVPIGGVKGFLPGVKGGISLEMLASCLTRGNPDRPVVGVVDANLSSPLQDIELGPTDVPVIDVTGLNWREI